ncbi:hypothetical protein ACWDZX_06365 [Streptomyces collinus]
MAEAMRRAVRHYQEAGAADSAALGVFWLFVGFGRGELAAGLVDAFAAWLRH